MSSVSISVFEGDFGRSSRSRSLARVLKYIKEPGAERAKHFVDVRRELAAGKEEKYKQFKKKLEAVTFSGLFSKERKKDQCTKFSRLACLDLDHVSETGMTVQEARNAIEGLPQTLVCFLSPSGDGLKVVVKFSCRVIDFEIMYVAVLRYYQQCTKLKFDAKTKDICRLCYLSYDPDLFYQEDATPFKPKYPMLKEIAFSRSFAEKRSPWAEGRNNHLYVACCCLHRFGIAAEEIKVFCVAEYPETGFDESEIAQIVASAVKNPDGATWNIENPPKNVPSQLNAYQRAAARMEIGLTEEHILLENVVRVLLEEMPMKDKEPSRLYTQFVRNLLPAAASLSNRKYLEAFIRRVITFQGEPMDEVIKGLSERSRIVAVVNAVNHGEIEAQDEYYEWRKIVVLQQYAADRVYEHFNVLFHRSPQISRSGVAKSFEALARLEKAYNSARQQIDRVLEDAYSRKQLARETNGVLADVAIQDQ